MSKVLSSSLIKPSVKSQYDIIVIGGGIQGASTALLAKKAGYSVLLVEKNTWASGTSSKSSKLIHGGLRYLQTGQFKLVYECLKERNWMLEKMPALVKPNWFYIPIYKGGHFKAWQVHFGLWLYKLLSGRGKYSSYKKITRKDILSKKENSFSDLMSENLECMFAYQDAQTDDEALTQYIVSEAKKAGVDCFERTECLSSKVDDKTPQLTISIEGQEQRINCHIVVNATGPWVNAVLKCLNVTDKILAVDLVQGSHIIISAAVNDKCFYLEAPFDNRVVFCLPWKGKTMVGTTELLHKGKPEAAVATEEEITYLTDVVVHYFPNLKFEVESSFCGLRVLPASEKKAFLRSRDTIFHRTNHIVSIYGGKLTAWRSSAKKLLDIIDSDFRRKSKIDIDNII
ncbi:MAG: glycerol-3-phosphate dehydrogenase/oxidase [Cellvibrionaceae bacterium]